MFMKKLNIVWQRVVLDDKTCSRCSSTEKNLERAVKKMKRALAPLNIIVDLKKKKIGKAAFKRNPSRSNLIRINGKTLEHWLGAHTGHSPCCGPCGDDECRTVKVASKVYKTIPESLIIKACLIAVAGMIK